MHVVAPAVRQSVAPLCRASRSKSLLCTYLCMLLHLRHITANSEPSQLHKLQIFTLNTTKIYGICGSKVYGIWGMEEIWVMELISPHTKVGFTRAYRV